MKKCQCGGDPVLELSELKWGYLVLCPSCGKRTDVYVASLIEGDSVAIRNAVECWNRTVGRGLVVA